MLQTPVLLIIKRVLDDEISSQVIADNVLSLIIWFD